MEARRRRDGLVYDLAFRLDFFAEVRADFFIAAALLFWFVALTGFFGAASFFFADAGLAVLAPPARAV